MGKGIDIEGMFHRDAEEKLCSLAKVFPILTVMGPRGSGKRSLVRKVFPDHAYCSLENLDFRLQAQENPEEFLAKGSQKMIIHEAQYAPELLSYIQALVEGDKQAGQFILTGSEKLLLNQKTIKFMGGHVGILELLPLSLKELSVVSEAEGDELNTWIYSGLYPGIYDKKELPVDFYGRYIRNYLDRDIEVIKKIANSGRFLEFMRSCATRTGNLLNVQHLATDCGISYTEAKEWLRILEANYIVFLLKPHSIAFGKKMVTQDKLFFYDTGLASWLLGIENADQLQEHYLRGGLFENFVIAEYLKYRFNRGLPNNAYFWRDTGGDEVDLLIEDVKGNIPIELKASKTLNANFFNGLAQYCRISKQKIKNSVLIYGGDRELISDKGKAISWRSLKKSFDWLG